MLKLYTLAQCSTCRDAVKWLRARGVTFDERAIRETPPTVAELRTMLAAYDGQLRRIFNTSGIEYRAQKLGDRLDSLSEAEALKLLAGNGSLVKRTAWRPWASIQRSGPCYLERRSAEDLSGETAETGVRGIDLCFLRPLAQAL
jgi:arsenate reductase